MRKTVTMLLSLCIIMILGLNLPDKFYVFDRPPDFTRLEELGIFIKYEGELTRAQAVAILANAFMTENLKEVQDFSDLPKEHACYEPVMKAYRSGWVSQSDSFQPDRAVTRYEAYTFLGRAAGYPVNTTSSDLPKEIQSLLENQILTQVDLQMDKTIEASDFYSLVLAVMNNPPGNSKTSENIILRDSVRNYLNGDTEYKLTVSSSFEKERYQTLKDNVDVFNENTLTNRKNGNYTIMTERIGDGKCSAEVTYKSEFPVNGELKTMRCEEIYYLQKADGNWSVYDSLERMSNDTPIKLSWEYVSKPDAEYTFDSKAEIVSPTWYKILSSKEHEIPKNAVLLNESETQKLYLGNYTSQSYADTAQKKEKEIWALVSNGFNPDINRQFIKDKNARFTLIKEMIKSAKQLGVTGINVDFENMYEEDKTDFNDFVRQLSFYAHKTGLIVSVDITRINTGSKFYSMCYDRKTLNNISDYLMLMSYDQFPRTSKTAGTIASIQWTEEGIQGVLNEVDSDRLVLGIPFYTRLWQEENGEVVQNDSLSMDQAQEILEENGAVAAFHAETGQNYAEFEKDNKVNKIWLEDETSLKSRSELVKKYQLAGIGTWRSGDETENAWDIINDALGSQEK